MTIAATVTTAENYSCWARGTSGFSVEAFGSNNKSSPRQPGMEAYLFESITVSLNFLFEFLTQVNPNVVNQKTASSKLYPFIYATWVNVQLEIRHLVWIVGSWKQTSRHTTSNYSFMMTTITPKLRLSCWVLGFRLYKRFWIKTCLGGKKWSARLHRTITLLCATNGWNLAWDGQLITWHKVWTLHSLEWLALV